MFLRGCPFSETVLASASAKASAVVILNTPGRAMVSLAIPLGFGLIKGSAIEGPRRDRDCV